MPESKGTAETVEGYLIRVERTAEATRIAADELHGARVGLRRAMHVARKYGASLGKLSEASGLSIAQVQRICDLSKDRSE